MMKSRKIIFALLGQSYFTYKILDNLLKIGIEPRQVLIENSKIENDPFKGIVVKNEKWFNEHIIYHYEWLNLIKMLCGERNIRLDAGKNILEKIEDTYALIVAGYAIKIPSYILKKYGDRVINIHPSILPMFKGPQPEAHMILNDNYNYSGISIHKITNTWDSGKIYWQKRICFNDYFNVGMMEEVEAKVACIGINDLFNKLPCVRRYNKIEVFESSYDTWYDTSRLILDSKSFDERYCMNIFRLRPEGYAYIDTKIGKMYPIYANDVNKSTYDESCTLVGGVLKANNELKYMGRDEVIKFMEMVNENGRK